MIKRILYTVVFVAAFICLSGCSFIVGSNYLYQNGDKYTAGDRQIKDKIENISIDYMFGNVKLIGADTDMISVKETSSVRLDDKRKVHTWVDGTTLYVRYCASAKNIDLNNLNKELTVTIPEDMILSDLYVDVSSADVSCENFKSDSVNVNSSSGSINAECEARMIKLSASSGDVYLTQKGSDREEGPDQYVSNFCTDCTVGFKYFDLSKTSRIRVNLQGYGTNCNVVIRTKEDGEIICRIPVRTCKNEQGFIGEFPEGLGEKEALYFSVEGRGTFDFISFDLK